ncbi:hypothetical protein N7494_000230 [Penicillium frequentans]|uniref:NB-ARC domain-containing protein n=1 Tax=Penicillium frequentans TaxID=3151616 RepID=A0AAD6D5D5_9EURO|nr:hypothetical protein N7494_000230 [Penicillium glabrum]
MPMITNFVGRQDELDNTPPSQKVVVLHGLGGIGKTQLAIRFARDHRDHFTAIFWLNGKNLNTLLQSLSSALNRIPGQGWDSKAINDREVEQRARHMLRWLALDGNSRWLIIFDNIDQYSPFSSAIGDRYDIWEFFPKAYHGSILITSRLQDVTELGEPFPVHRLDSYNSTQLLLQSSGLAARNTTSKLDSNPDILTLTDRLGGLPLAIIIAGAFMRETGTSITEYLEYYQESWSELQLQSNPGRQYQQGNILQTWMISYLEIQKRDPSAAHFLLLLARFDNHDIWYELVKNSCHSSNIPDWLKKAISSGLAFKICVKSLIRFSLLESKQQEGSYIMHPVVQDWCLHVANTDKNVNWMQLNELALISIGYSVPSESDRIFSELQQRLLPHANHIYHLDLSDDNIEIWWAFLRLGDLYYYQGKLKEAEEMFQRALAGYKKALGPNHLSTLKAVNNLGVVYNAQNKLKEAEEMFQRALLGYETALPNDISTLEMVNNLGGLYRIQGKLKEAEQMYQRALAGREKALGPDHISTLDIVTNVAGLYFSQGKLREAEQMYQRGLAGYKKALAPNHISILDTVNNLGIVYENQGKLKEAEDMYERALTGKEKVLGPDHISTLKTVNNLGNLYKVQGKLKEAEQMYQRALAGKEKKALGLKDRTQ